MPQMHGGARLIRSQLAAYLLAHVERHGGDACHLAETLSLPGESTRVPELVLSVEKYGTLQKIAELETRDPCLGAHVAVELTVGTLGLVELCARSAPTVGDVF